ncbi:MAG: LuxR C-terminal-related transcriptional regulator [Candidatus Paceibacterota bacterium]|jgi:DNA-binding NarL/FixJ family response regulator
MIARPTTREIEMLDLVSQGCVYKQVAYKLGIAEQTVKNTMSTMCRRFNARTPAQMVRLMLEMGYLPIRKIDCVDIMKGYIKLD